jgi:hyperosmotically inducible protein
VLAACIARHAALLDVFFVAKHCECKRYFGQSVATEEPEVIRMNHKVLRAVVSSVALCASYAALGAPQQPSAADNTKENRRDRAKSEPTADQAKNSLSDREAMQRIRKSLNEDKSLSTYAHNVKIIAQNGKVTLKGPVRSEEEKKTVEQKAVDVAGGGNVTNEITIKPDRTNK